jgi:hypothetical protein
VLDFEGHGFGKALVPLARSQTRKQVPKDQQRLKERLESPSYLLWVPKDVQQDPKRASYRENWLWRPHREVGDWTAAASSGIGYGELQRVGSSC